MKFLLTPLLAISIGLFPAVTGAVDLQQRQADRRARSAQMDAVMQQSADQARTRSQARQMQQYQYMRPAPMYYVQPAPAYGWWIYGW